MNSKIEKLNYEKKSLITVIDNMCEQIKSEESERKRNKLIKNIEAKINQLKNNIIKTKSYGADSNEQVFIDKSNMLKNLVKEAKKK